MIVLSSDGLRATLSPEGAAVRALTLEDGGPGSPVEILQPMRGRLPAAVGGAFPLVPFGNRIAGDHFTLRGRRYDLLANTADPCRLHGDGWLRRWTVDRAEGARVVLRIEVDADAGNPWSYCARQTLTLGPGTLDLALAVTNRAATAMPFGLGWHPFFPLTPDLAVEADAASHFVEGPGHLPVARAPVPEDLRFRPPRRPPSRWINNGFDGWHGRATLRWPARGIAVSLTAEPVFDRFVLYRAEPGAPDTGFLCFEPMTHDIDGVHAADLGGMRLLEPGETFTARLTLTVARLPG